MARPLALLLLASALSACSSDMTPPDQSPSPVDSSAPDRPAGADQPRAPDRSLVDAARPDGASSLPATCTGSCATQSLTAKFGSVTEPIERSTYGVEKDAAGKVGLYVEALHGGFSGCPTQSSPTPDRTLVISGLPLPVDGTPISKGLSVTLLDFKGTLLKTPMSKASAATVTFRAANVCASCLGKPAPSHPGGFVAFDLEATFPEGTVSGHLYAVHCDSLDEAS